MVVHALFSNGKDHPSSNDPPAFHPRPTIFAANAIFPDTSNFQWQLPVIIQFIPGGFLLLGAFIIPETPQYLAGKENWSVVAKSLVWLRQLPNDSEEIMQEMHEVQVAAELSAKMLRTQRNVSFFRDFN